MFNFILNNKKLFFIFLILFILIILIFKDKIFNKIFNKNNINLFNRTKEVTFDEEKNKTLEIPKKFIESNTFQGKKENYVFKKDSLGIGYYLDE
jgi:regulatory protein YycI of two-component signal transduction system YycFG